MVLHLIIKALTYSWIIVIILGLMICGFFTKWLMIYFSDNKDSKEFYENAIWWTGLVNGILSVFVVFYLRMKSFSMPGMNSFNPQGNKFITGMNKFNQQGNQFMQQANNLNQQGNQFRQFGDNIRQQGNQFKQFGNNIRQQGNQLRQQGNQIKQSANNLKR